MTETGEDVDLQEELGQIKQAMGLQEAYPYWWHFWIVEGLAVGVVFPIMQLGFREGFRPWIIALTVGVLIAYEVVLWRMISTYERPTTGVPSWRTWHIILFGGMGTLIVGTGPYVDAIEFAQLMPLWLVLVGTLIGVAYLYLGQLLSAYNIRDADCYAFFLGGFWSLILVATIPYVPAARGWEFAVFGVGYAVYCLSAYAVLSKV
ncbi:hypothetical protein [Haladaptatus sp. DYF46]|uniref:hypothetical protein n=1 Tax=Haladaptatus sp. DYF46 TaxID=2886041 RepID=UPI001E2C680E|nr:hypothetical protein [Haladaptatus sp. DYF46]